MNLMPSTTAEGLREGEREKKGTKEAVRLTAGKCGGEETGQWASDGHHMDLCLGPFQTRQPMPGLCEDQSTGGHPYIWD